MPVSRFLLAMLAPFCLDATLGKIARAADRPVTVYENNNPPAVVYPNDYRPASPKSISYPAYNWRGLYFGLNAGGALGSSQWDDPLGLASTGTFKVSGAPLIGATLGYNWQSGAWFWGIEGDFDLTNIRGGTACGLGFCETRNSWIDTARGRIGYAWDRLVPYFTVGLAFGNIKADIIGNRITNSTIKAGFTVGTGLEFAVYGPWTAKLEYLYVNLGSFSCSSACDPASSTEVSFDAHTIKGGVNYRF